MDKFILQWCPTCKAMVRAPLMYEYNANRQQIRDRSVCPTCHRVLWDWQWNDGKPYVEKRPKIEQLKLF